MGVKQPRLDHVAPDVSATLADDPGHAPQSGGLEHLHVELDAGGVPLVRLERFLQAVQQRAHRGDLLVRHPWHGGPGGEQLKCPDDPVELVELLDREACDNVAFGAFCVLVAAFVYFVSHRIVYSPLGRVLRALRENEDAAASLGKFVRRFRGVVFAVSSAMAAVSGSLYAHFMSYVSPLDFTVHLTVLVLTMVIVAGTGRLWAVPVAALLVMGITDGVRYVELPQRIAPGAQQILYGLMLVLFAVFRPDGLLGRKRDRRPPDARSGLAATPGNGDGGRA